MNADRNALIAEIEELQVLNNKQVGANEALHEEIYRLKGIVEQLYRQNKKLIFIGKRNEEMFKEHISKLKSNSVSSLARSMGNLKM